MRVILTVLFLLNFNTAIAVGETCRDLFVLSAAQPLEIQVPIEHIRGDLVSTPEGVTVIAGGLHTWTGLKLFLKQRPELTYKTTTRNKNGVIHILLPEEAFTRRAWDRMQNSTSNLPGGKTLFPQTWQESLIVQAIRHVIRYGRHEEHSTGVDIFEGVYNQVRLRVVLREGEFVTAYPLSNQ